MDTTGAGVFDPMGERGWFWITAVTILETRSVCEVFGFSEIPTADEVLSGAGPVGGEVGVGSCPKDKGAAFEVLVFAVSVCLLIDWSDVFEPKMAGVWRFSVSFFTSLDTGVEVVLSPWGGI